MRRLASILDRIDGRGYPAYKDLRGEYEFPSFHLRLDHIQGDPFAAPSRLSVIMPAPVAAWPAPFLDPPIRRVALADFLARRVADSLARLHRTAGSGGSGRFEIDAGAQEILRRTACTVSPDGAIEIRVAAGLPAFGRRIDGRGARRMLLEQLPESVAESLPASANDHARAFTWCATAEDQQSLRAQLPELGLVAFVADGSILPRESGVSQHPLHEGAIPFRSPDSLAVELRAPHRGPVRGMGIREGVTLIVGGGFHGKSTLLHAIERGIYDHIPGDGRDGVVTLPHALKIRAEDGRAVTRVDISGFIGALPGGADTTDFLTPNASGSTSQAAAIVEAIEAGSRLLLLDEDTCATNFMIRDERMQALVAKEHEPITALIDQLPHLRDAGLSLVIVMGGCGDYLDAADTVLAMIHFQPSDVTERARSVCAEHPSRRLAERGRPLPSPDPRVLQPRSFPPGKRGDPKIRVRDRHTLAYEHCEIDLSGMEQIADASQTRALGEILHRLARERRAEPLPDLLRRLARDLAESGPDAVSDRRAGDLAEVRPAEIAGMLNRYRSLSISRANR